MSQQGSVRQSGIPRQTYTMPLRFEDYMLAMLGVITGFEGFNNNFLMAESFMKVLPQFEIKLNMKDINVTVSSILLILFDPNNNDTIVLKTIPMILQL